MVVVTFNTIFLLVSINLTRGNQIQGPNSGDTLYCGVFSTLFFLIVGDLFVKINKICKLTRGKSGREKTDRNRNPGWRLVLKFFRAIPQYELLHINFVFRRGACPALVAQTSHCGDWYFGFLLNWRKAILVAFNLSAKPGRHRVLTAVSDAKLERQISLNFSRALFVCLFVFSVWWFSLPFDCR